MGIDISARLQQETWRRGPPWGAPGAQIKRGGVVSARFTRRRVRRRSIPPPLALAPADQGSAGLRDGTARPPSSRHFRAYALGDGCQGGPRFPPDVSAREHKQIKYTMEEEKKQKGNKKQTRTHARAHTRTSHLLLQVVLIINYTEFFIASFSTPKSYESIP